MRVSHEPNSVLRPLGITLAVASVGCVVVHVLLWRLLFFGWFAGIAPWALVAVLGSPFVSEFALGIGNIERKQPLVSLVGGICLIASVVSILGVVLVFFVFGNWRVGG